MNYKKLRGYQRQEKLSKSQLALLPDTFYDDVAEYAKEVKANEEYDLLKNVYAITNLIKEVRLQKLFNKSAYYVHHNVNLEEVKNIQNILPGEVEMFTEVLKVLYKYDQEIKLKK